jgi:heptosyltransferase II
VQNDKVLIVGPSWVGDMVMAQCLFKLLKQQEPSVQIDVLAMDFLHPLLKCMPEVREAISLSIKHGEFGLGKRYRLGRKLSQQNYNQAIVLPNSFKSALIPFFARIPQRTGWRGEWRYGLLNDLRILNKQNYPLMIERFVALGLTQGANLPDSSSLPQLKVSKKAMELVLKKFGLVLDKPVLALCPGAEYGPAKQWPAEYFAEVASTKLAEGWQVWLFGSQRDTKIAQIIQKDTDHGCVDLTGKTDLGEAIDLLSLAQAVVTNDSGLMHVASALNLFIIAIYGSSSPKFTPPLGKKVQVLSSDIDCSPCFERECKHGHYRCLRDLNPKLVLELFAGRV